MPAFIKNIGTLKVKMLWRPKNGYLLRTLNGKILKNRPMFIQVSVDSSASSFPSGLTAYIQT